MLLQLLGKAIFKYSKWTAEPWPEGLKQCIVIEAPHTSMMDFFLGKLYFSSKGMRIYVLIKKEMFFFPAGSLLKILGAIPVDRNRASRLVLYLSEKLKEQKDLILVITPEATRKPVTRWKMGFFYIALKTGLPVAVSYIDYEKKKMGVIEVFKPTEDMDIETEMKRIKSLYKGVMAKYPKNFTCE